MDDGQTLKKIAKKVMSMSDTGTRKNRTLSLSDRNFRILQDYCSRKNLKVSQLIDNLIAAFNEEMGLGAALDSSASAKEATGVKPTLREPQESLGSDD